ncbi:MAG: 30S ribosome-binding factor RbfA [Azoarcus sp.]|jgi:ribosome-binding factor A|nr:30S ribosome-binding factor RbfA [Azoarcus sp.]
MPKEYSRGQRVAGQIRRELADLIRQEVKDPRVNLISLTEVELSPDYAHAKIFLTAMGGTASAPEVLEGLRHAAGFLRRELGRRIRIHTLPELHFHYDSSVEEGSRLSQLIDQTVREDAARAQAIDENPSTDH